MDKEARRRRVLPSLLLAAASAALLALAAEGGGGGALQRSLDKIAGGLRVALQDFPEAPNYTDYRSNARYDSEEAEFSPGGMAGLYNFTQAFVYWIVPKDVLMEGLILYEGNGNYRLNTNVPAEDVLSYYWGLVAVCAILLLATALFLLCGMCVCCCRCCGRCGARARPAGKRKDICRKVVGGMALICLATGLLFCVVCAYGSNQQLQTGLDEFSDNMDTSVDDVDTFLENVVNETGNLLVLNFKEFTDEFSKTLSNSSGIVMEKLEEYSNATAMMDLAKFADALPEINTSMFQLKEGTNNLRVYASRLNDAMRKLKNDLLTTLNNCMSFPGCKSIYDEIVDLRTQIDFNLLPDMSDQLISLESINITAIQNAAVEGKSKLANVEQEIGDKMTTSIEEAQKQITQAAQTINSVYGDLSKTLEDARKSLKDGTKSNINRMRGYIADYGPYRNYVGIAIATIILLIVLCIALGLVCGVCGKRPDGYTDNCCNKGAGARFLMCGVTLMFLLGAILSIVCLILLVGGVAVDKVVCSTLKDPYSSPRTLSLLNNLNLPLNTTVEAMFNGCAANQSAYQVFNLDTMVNITDIQKKLDIDHYLDMIKQDTTYDFDKFYLLSETEKQQFIEISNSDLSADSDKFEEELQDGFLTVNLNDLSNQLEVLIKEGSGRIPDTVITDLKLSQLHIETYNEKILIPMNETAKNVLVTAKQLDEQLKMGQGSFKDAINNLLKEIDDAESTLKTNGGDLLQNTTMEFAEIVKKQVNSYLYRVGNHTEREIGKCGPLSLVLNATLVNSCDKIIVPLNGLWFSYLWAVILFAISIIVSIMVASLYQKYKQYGQYVETRGKHRPPKKKPKKKAKKYEERSSTVGGSGDAVTREYGPQGAPDARYADMAPKDFKFDTTYF